MTMQEKWKDITDLRDVIPQDEPWVSLPEGDVVFVRHPSDSEIADIHALTQTEITVSTVPLSVFRAVYRRNQDSFWGIYRAADKSKTNPCLIGFYALLLLTQAGRVALERGEFDASNPDLSLLAPGGTRPAAIYVWGVVARKVARKATPLVAWALGSRLYAGIPLYATAGTLGGLNAIKSYGFAGARQSEGGLGGLFRLDPPTPSQSSTEAA